MGMLRCVRFMWRIRDDVLLFSFFCVMKVTHGMYSCVVRVFMCGVCMCVLCMCIHVCPLLPAGSTRN